MASPKGAFLTSFVSCVLLLGCTSSVVAFDEPCVMQVYTTLRSEWDGPLEPCHKKLPYELWLVMKGEGSAQNTDAKYVRANCIASEELGLLELITPEGYIMPENVKDAPGDVISETKHATTYAGATAATLEAFCEDEDISQVSRVEAALESYGPFSRKARRHLQSTINQAVQAHEVAELISGLQSLGCSRTTGEEQTVCVMSNSFNANGEAPLLQASGDLPEVDVVKDFLDEDQASDEGSAMIEIMYDIASGASYKFNSGFHGLQNFADDIGVMVDEEACDVIIDDIIYFREPAFRDGPIADAVNAAAESGALFFSSGGNDGTGWRFDSNFECSAESAVLYGGVTPACGATGVASHVFQPDVPASSVFRYMFELSQTSTKEMYYAHWDADIGTVQDVLIRIYVQDPVTEELSLFVAGDKVSGGDALEYVTFEPNVVIDADGNEVVDSSYKYFLQIIHQESGIDDLAGEFLMTSTDGIEGKSDGSMRGHACAENSLAVSAIYWGRAGGPGGSFEDPETSSVNNFSSRGPCIVSGEVRNKPTTCAADGLETSTPGFDQFLGTSASGAVAAAIATIVRAACFPKVVAHAEIMEMLTNYEYTVDYTSDAGGAAETWGAEAGYGIISASQMLAWVEANCSAECGATTSSGTEVPPTSSGTEVPPTSSGTEVPPTSSGTEVPPTASGTTCSDGTEGIEGGSGACCPVECNQCGGSGCSTSGEAAGLTATQCCTGDIIASNVYCDGVNGAPCIVGNSDPGVVAQTCSDGTEGIDSGGVVCCPTGCTGCGGSGCSSMGAAAGLGAEDCCGGQIMDSERYCSVTNAAPCIIGSPPDVEGTPDGTVLTCSDGTEGIEGGSGACCPVECNQCGGSGCSTSGEAAGLTATQCCTGDIIASNVYCDGVNGAPCIVGSDPGLV